MAKRSLTTNQRLTTDQPAPPLEGGRKGAQGAPCPKSKKYFLDCVNGRGIGVLRRSVGRSLGHSWRCALPQRPGGVWIQLLARFRGLLPGDVVSPRFGGPLPPELTCQESI